ncbi:hypothetical protein KSS87_020599, partial [Heliosperma pusillum]
MKNDLDISKEKNKLLSAKIEKLGKELNEAKHVSKKWEGSQNVLNFLTSQSKRCDRVAGLGFKWNSQSHCYIQKPDPSKTDFRKRKYVGLPEYIICNYCGKTGHVFNACKKRHNDIERNVKVVKQIWIRK